MRPELRGTPTFVLLFIVAAYAKRIPVARISG